MPPSNGWAKATTGRSTRCSTGWPCWQRWNASRWSPGLTKTPPLSGFSTANRIFWSKAATGRWTILWGRRKSGAGAARSSPSRSCTTHQQQRWSIRSAAVRLQNNLCAQLNHPIGRNIEIAGGTVGVTEHGDEQFFTPERHFRIQLGNQGFAPQEERGFHHVERQPVLATQSQRSRSIRRFLEMVADLNSPE